MSQGWPNYVEPHPPGTSVTDWIDLLTKGVNAALTLNYGPTDPSLGNSWGAPELGTLWLDSNNEIGGAGDGLGPVLKRWSILDATPTYGWRIITARTFHSLDPNIPGLVLLGQSNTPWTILNLTAETSPLALAVDLQVETQDSGGPGGIVELRKVGVGGDANSRRVYTQVAAVPTTGIVTVEMDQNQNLEYQFTATGGGTLDVRLDVLGYYERW